MSGFSGQKFDFTGEDGAWYALISDIPSLHMNMRVTSPVADMPEITYITGLSLITTDEDGQVRTIEITVNDPHTLESTCPYDSCLADGALTVLLDSEESLAMPGTISMSGDVSVTAANLPGACRSFGFEQYWEKKILQAGRRLSRDEDLGEWILADPTATNPTECLVYVLKAMSEKGEEGLFFLQSEHASFEIVTPAAVIRLNHGRLHQIAMRDPTNKFDIPDHKTWQMNMAIDHHDLTKDAQGILGETQVLTVDSDGRPIMHGMESIRGQQEDCEYYEHCNSSLHNCRHTTSNHYCRQSSCSVFQSFLFQLGACIISRRWSFLVVIVCIGADVLQTRVAVSYVV